MIELSISFFFSRSIEKQEMAARIPDNEMSNENEDEDSNDRYRIVKIPSAVAGEFLFATKVRRRRS